MTKVIQMTPKDAEIEAPNKEIESMVDELMDKAAEMEFKLFEKAVRTNATPPITGDITPGKLKWRGIRRCFNKRTNESWLEQRGLQISEKFRIVFK